MLKKTSFLLGMLGLTLFLISPAVAFNTKQLTIPAPPSSLPGLPASGVEGLRSFGEIQAELQRQGIDQLPGNISGQLAGAKEAAKALGESLTPEQRQAISEAFATHEPTLKGLIAQTEVLRNQSAGKTFDMGKARELYAQVKSWETALNADVEKVMTWQQRSQHLASRQEVPDPQGDEQTLKALGIDPAASGSEGPGERVGSQSQCYYGYYYGYYGNLNVYYAYIYAYYAYVYTNSDYAYYAYAYNSYSYTYSYYGYLYASYAYSYYPNSTYAYYGYLYNYYGYVYANAGYTYGYYAYAYTGHTYAYYAYYYGSYANTYCYYGYYYSYYCYTDTSPTTKTLNVAQINQETTNWCWAASSQMIMYYAGTWVYQCQEANYVHLSTDGSTCCYDPYKNSTSYCNKGATDSQMYYNFYHWGFYNTLYSSYLSYSNVQSQINNNRPFNIHWVWKSGGGHAVVVRGYDSSQNLYINDPWYGQQTRSYSSTVDASDRYWYSTLIDIHK